MYCYDMLILRTLLRRKLPLCPSEFLQRAAMRGRNARIASAVLPTAVPSVRPSHTGIVSKRRHVARCSLDCQIAKCLEFCRNQKKIPQERPLPPEILAPSHLPTPEGSEF